MIEDQKDGLKNIMKRSSIEEHQYVIVGDLCILHTYGGVLSILNTLDATSKYFTFCFPIWRSLNGIGFVNASFIGFDLV